MPLDAGDMSGELSASAIVGGTVTFHHLLHIDGYSQTKQDLPTGNYIQSRPISAGGRSWYISYYPNGIHPFSGFISLFLSVDENFVVRTRSAIPVRGKVRFSLLDQAGKQVPEHTKTTGLVDLTDIGGGYGDFIKRAWLEESEYLKDDCFAIRCDAVIYTGLRVEDRSPAPAPRRFVAVPPSDLHRHFGDLLAHKEGADVTFLVAGETFKAHRCVLAARSPVFRAQLLGPMKEAGVVVSVDDMDAQVFRALLCFAYTDALPECPDDADKQEQAALAQHLLVAADRYNLERLKLICEDRLCDRIEPGTVATILALAEQHHCRGLKDACLQFLSTPMNLSAVMATDGFDHLTRSCPSVVKELMSNIASRISI